MSGESVTVKIYGESYPLRTGENAAYIEEIARHVDARMREVAASGKVVVTSKIAVLAALHIADELFTLRREQGGCSVGERRRIETLVERLDVALAGSSGTPGDPGD